MSKNLQKLRKQGLLKSKSYGLIPKKGASEYFWSLAKHDINKEYGYVPPRAEVHANKYTHEKLCTDVFVALAITGVLEDWKAHTKIANGVIPDRTAKIGGETYFFEIERGTQNAIAQKLWAYQQHYRQSKEDFRVIFLVMDQSQIDAGQKILDKATNHYSIILHSDFCQNPFAE